MKSQITSILSSGYGHKKVTITYSNGKNYSAVTDHMDLIDQYNSETFSRRQERERKRAIRCLIRIVKDRNNLR